MAVERVTPVRAAQLLREGWAYVDVRTIPEFEAGHPEGAYNVPLLYQDASGRSPNPSFLAVMERAFSRDAPLIVGCRSGRRSLRAAEVLLEAGFERVLEMRGGFEGEAGEGGGGCEGWQPRGLPVATAAAPGRAYADLRASGR